MSERYDELQEIFSKIDPSIQTLVKPLLKDCCKWEAKIVLYQTRLDQLPLCRKNQEQYLFFAKLLKEAQQQYNNIIKTLIMALSRYTEEGKDAFDQWLDSMNTRDRVETR